MRAGAAAQLADYLVRPLRFVIPFRAGGVPDIIGCPTAVRLVLQAKVEPE